MLKCAGCSKPIGKREDLVPYSFLLLSLQKPYHRKCYEKLHSGFRVSWKKVYPAAFLAWVILTVVLILAGEHAMAAFALILLALAVALWSMDRLYVKVKFEDKLR